MPFPLFAAVLSSLSSMPISLPFEPGQQISVPRSSIVCVLGRDRERDDFLSEPDTATIDLLIRGLTKLTAFRHRLCDQLLQHRAPLVPLSVQSVVLHSSGGALLAHYTLRWQEADLSFTAEGPASRVVEN